MPAWRDLPVSDLAAVARVVRGLHTPQAEPKLPEDIQELGAKTYAANCAQCHGEKGAGDGSAAGQFALAPVDFRRQRPTLAQSLRTLRNGIDGTEMAPWTGRLSEAELSAVAYYARSFFEGEGAPQ